MRFLIIANCICIPINIYCLSCCSTRVGCIWRDPTWNVTETWRWHSWFVQSTPHWTFILTVLSSCSYNKWALWLANLCSLFWKTIALFAFIPRGRVPWGNSSNWHSHLVGFNMIFSSHVIWAPLSVRMCRNKRKQLFIMPVKNNRQIQSQSIFWLLSFSSHSSMHYFSWLVV